MRKHFKKVSFFMAFLGALFTSCEKDLYENQIGEPHTAPFFVNIVNLKDLPQINSIVKQRIGEDYKINIPQNSSKRVTEINGIIILQEEVIQIIENDGDKSYSLKAYDPASQKDSYNYLITDKNGIISSILIRYNSDTNWLLSKNGVFDLKTFTGMFELINDSGTLVYQQNIVNGMAKPCDPTISSNSGGGQTGNPVGDNNYNNSSGSSYSSSFSPIASYKCACCNEINATGVFNHNCHEPSILIISFPRLSGLPPCLEEEIPFPDDDGVLIASNSATPPTPCEELQKLVEHSRVGTQSIKQSVALLKQKVESANNDNEIGFETEKTVNPTTGDPLYVNTAVPIGDETTVGIGTGTNFIGGGHSHPNSGVGMFSFGDVRLLRNIYKEVSNSKTGEVYYLLVCKDDSGATKYYSLKVNNYNDLNNYVNDMINDNNNNGALTEKETIDKIHKKQEITYDAEPNKDYEKSFLKQFKDFGISLYSASDQYLTDWKKLQLNSNGAVEPVPCN